MHISTINGTIIFYKFQNQNSTIFFIAKTFFKTSKSKNKRQEKEIRVMPGKMCIY